MENNPVKIMLVDDHAVVRAGLRGIIDMESDFRIVGEAADGVEAVTKALELQPDIIIMDIFMPRATGIEALAEIRAKLPGTKVIMLTVSDSDSDLFTALSSGAHGYLLKSSSIHDVIKAVKMTAAGEAILSPKLATRLVTEFKKTQSPKITLTEREIEVLRMVGEGLTNSEIARSLFIEDTTVRTHLQRLMYKLNLKNRAEAIAYAQRNNLGSFRLNPPEAPGAGR